MAKRKTKRIVKNPPSTVDYSNDSEKQQVERQILASSAHEGNMYFIVLLFLIAGALRRNKCLLLQTLSAETRLSMEHHHSCYN